MTGQEDFHPHGWAEGPCNTPSKVTTKSFGFKQRCHSEEVAAATDEESAFAVKEKQIPLPRLRDRNDRPGDFHPHLVGREPM